MRQLPTCVVPMFVVLYGQLSNVHKIMRQQASAQRDANVYLNGGAVQLEATL